VTSLEIGGLCKAYAARTVLKELGLSVPPGSFTAILGPSGSGKTTLLRIIAGFERADRGTVRLADEIVDDGQRFITPDRRHVGYVPQEGSLFPHLSVEQNVGFGIARRDRRGRRVAELLEMVGLAGQQRRYPHQLSGGEQQRVSLARALAVDPALVLLDEPFSALDATLRVNVRQDVRRVLREAGTTTLLVTHDQDEALSLADRVAVIRDGRVGQCDTPQQIYAHPSTPELAVGLGETNFVRGVGRGGAVETPLGTLPLENGPFGEGAPLVVLVRPEQLSFAAGARSNGGGAGRVLDAEFYGHDALFRLRPDWDPATVVLVRTGDATSVPDEGAHVELSVRGGVVAWADEPDAPAGEAAEPSR
jgi:iron(III) transport system ATP-binding protein